MKQYPHCLFCSSSIFKLSWLRPTFYNDKLFKYLSCTSCNLIQVSPLPDAEDFKAMYPSTYQGGTDKMIHNEKKLPGLRFSYLNHFNIIKKHFDNPVVLDYGCGNGNFVFNALQRNLYCEGTEFGEEQVDILNKEIKGSRFYTIDDFLKNNNKKYDVIRLSNVLEHLTDPKKIMQLLTEHLSEKGIFLIEGPIENNFSFAYQCRKITVRLKNVFSSSRSEIHSVTHVFLSDRKNQRDFFTSLNLETLNFIVNENAWPYPESFNSAKGAGNKLKALLAQVSMFISQLFPNWGNTFLFIGRKNV